jgi:predicted ATPase
LILHTTLDELSLRNFKSFDETGVTIKFGKITVFVGPNGTGKSSILQALLLLKQSRAQTTLQLDGPYVSLGSFRELTYQHDIQRPITMCLSANYQDFMEFTNTGSMDTAIPTSGTYTYCADFAPGAINNVDAILAGSDKIIRTTWPPRSMQPYPNEVDFQVYIKTFRLSTQPHIARALYLSNYQHQGGPFSEAPQQALEELLATLDNLLQRTSVVPAIRGFSTRLQEVKSYGAALPDDIPFPPDPRDQQTLIANIIASEPELADRVSQRIAMVLSTEQRQLLGPLAEGKIAAQMSGRGRRINLVNEAYGLNQLVILLLWVSMVRDSSVVGIEEPEIHLHPRAQARLCDVFVDLAKNEQKQLILTTHSEHIVMGLLTAVARGELSPEHLAVYEFQRNGESVRAERLEVNEYGQIEGGLRGFLEVDVEELSDFIQARFRPEQQ